MLAFSEPFMADATIAPKTSEIGIQISPCPPAGAEP